MTPSLASTVAFPFPVPLTPSFYPRRLGPNSAVSRSRTPGQAATHVLVTANRDRLARLLTKGLVHQGWKTSVATTPHAVLSALQQTAVDLLLIDADRFQGDTAALVRAVDQRRSQVIVLAADYCISGQDLRHLVTLENIFIKPFSTQQLMKTLRDKCDQNIFEG